METPKKFLTFQETKFSYILGNGNPKKLLIFQKVTSELEKKKEPTLKKFLIFQEIELSSPKKLDTLNKTPLRETGCLSNLYYLLAAQASNFLIYPSFLNIVS